MAEIIQQDKGGKKGKPKKHSTHIDMTPMVDLACLLITFFMLTTAFSKPKVMEIILPDKKQDTTDKSNAPLVDKKSTYHVLISNDMVYWYNGLADPAKLPLPTVYKTDFSKDGLRKVLLEKNADLYTKIDELNQKFIKGELKITQDSLKNSIKFLKRKDKLGPIVLIKADKSAKYRNIVDVIDEMAICNIARYAIVDITTIELEMIKNAQ